MKKIYIIISVLIIGLGIFTLTVKANPLFFPPTVQSASATTTLTYMTAGTATTTLVFDTYNASSGVFTPTLSDALLIQFTGSSTGSLLKINLEYSHGYNGVECVSNPTGCDWYEDPAPSGSGYATTTKPFDLGQVNQFSLAYASSTPTLGGIGATSINPAKRILSVKSPTRYVRAIFTLPVGSTNGAIWAQFVPLKERQ